jgi:hypothetical protein
LVRELLSRLLKFTIELPVMDVEFALSKEFATSAAYAETLTSAIDARLKKFMSILSLR